MLYPSFFQLHFCELMDGWFHAKPLNDQAGIQILAPSLWKTYYLSTRRSSNKMNSTLWKIKAEIMQYI